MTLRPALLMLPGNMCDRRLWRGIEPYLDGWHVVHPDLDRDDSINAMAERAVGETDGPIIPIGFSMGGIVALMIATLAPTRISAVGLLDTNPASDMAERAAVRVVQQQAVGRGGLKDIVLHELMPNYLASANGSDIKLRALILDMALSLGANVFLRQSEALRTRPDQQTVIAKIKRPIFVACGRDDILCPPEWHERMAGEAADAQLHVIEGAGHMLPLEQPERLGRLLKAWLARLPVANAS